ncbi:MAG: hypothetical protein RL497_605 [Pseudomonadota bacterium]
MTKHKIAIRFISIALAIPILIVITYRYAIEINTYFWVCHTATLKNLTQINTRREGAITASYTVNGIGQAEYNRISPIAMDEYRSDQNKYYPIRFIEKIKQSDPLTACISKDRKTAVLFPGISSETIELSLIFLTLTLIAAATSKQDNK